MTTSTAGEARITTPYEGVLARLNARLRSHQLDQALARGTPAEAAVPLALRARRLTMQSRRRVIADSLRRVIRDACREVPPTHARISPRQSQVTAATNELNRLADALAGPDPVAARGVAQAWILLTDGTGPLYNGNSTASLSAKAASAADNLRLED